MKTKYLIILIPIILIVAVCMPINVITIKDMYSDEIYLLHRFSKDDAFTMRWIHSVELEPWEEIFGLNENNEIILLRTRFKAFGAGVPDSAGEETYIEDGYVVYDEINQVMPNLTYGISPIAKHTLLIGNQSFPLYEMMPPDSGIQITYNKILFLKYLTLR